MPTFNRRKLANDSLYIPNVDPGYFSNSFKGQPQQAPAPARPSNSNWSSAHGSDYQVPPEIQNHPDLKDNSWKNDLSPRFTAQRADGHTVDVWVEHPDPNARETGGKRFLVELRNPEDTPVEQEMTDDVHEALQLVQRFMGGGTGHGGAQSLDQINERLYDLSRKGPNMTPEESTEYKSLMDKRKQMGKGAPGFLQAWVRRHCKFAQGNRAPWDVELWPNMDENWRREKIQSIVEFSKDEWGQGDPYNYERDLRQLAAGNVGFWEELVDEYSKYYGLTPADIKSAVDQLDAMTKGQQQPAAAPTPATPPPTPQPQPQPDGRIAWTRKNCKFAHGTGPTLQDAIDYARKIGLSDSDMTTLTLQEIMDGIVARQNLKDNPVAKAIDRVTEPGASVPSPSGPPLEKTYIPSGNVNQDPWRGVPLDESPSGDYADLDHPNQPYRGRSQKPRRLPGQNIGTDAILPRQRA